MINAIFRRGCRETVRVGSCCGYFLRSGDLNGASTARSACHTHIPWSGLIPALGIVYLQSVAQMVRKESARQLLTVGRGVKED